MKSWLKMLFTGTPTMDPRVNDTFVSITSAFLGYGTKDWESVDSDRRVSRV